jgi:hypothetical protein
MIIDYRRITARFFDAPRQFCPFTAGYEILILGCP